MSTQTVSASTGLPIPSLGTIKNLAIGGIVGLFIWEIFARVITKAVLGDPLEPSGLIDAIAQNQFGLSINYWFREALHYAVGILGYPIAYYVISRMLPRWSAILDILAIVSFTAAILWQLSLNGFNWDLIKFLLVVALLIGTRFFFRDQRFTNAIAWGTFTWVNALAIMAPIGGLSFFLLGDSIGLSFMSFVGHVIYGAVAVLVFNHLQNRTA